MKTKREQIFEIDFKKETIGDLLRQARVSKNITQEQLAAQLGINKSNISKIEKNASSIKMETFLRLMNALQTKVRLKVEL
jgi:HTH-type transcriptional regulator / antitoxin HipB